MEKAKLGSKDKIETIVSQLVLPIASDLDLEFVDVEFVKEGAHWYLRVFLDKPGGLDVDDCQAVSQKLSDLLDEQDPITQAYFLEVSSPGLERPLKQERDFEKYKGQLVTVTTYVPFEGQKSFTGNLAGLIENNIVIAVKGEMVYIPKEKVASTKLTVEF